MKITDNKGLRMLIPEQKDNQILNITENIVSEVVYIARGISEDNMFEYFREITPEEAENIPIEPEIE